ncbi:MAG: hypothetical protein K0Q65_452 [Clostridia bacterium]|jgi:hypothetical protein|nr:hypothetical protein [Clostridia bacterium]
MNGLTVINHNNQQILTTAFLADAYETTERRISENFNSNKERYMAGKHFYLLKGDELKAFKGEYGNSVVAANVNKLYLWTEKGAFLHAKSLNTDKAWQVYEELVDHYFKLDIYSLSTYEQELKLFSQSADAMRLTRSQRMPVVLKLMHKYNVSTYGIEHMLPQSVIDRLAHSESVDNVDKFIIEKLRYSVNAYMQAIDLYDLYITWCIKYDIKPFSMRKFGDTIRNKLVDGREIVKMRRAAGNFYYGIEEAEDDQRD